MRKIIVSLLAAGLFFYSLAQAESIETLIFVRHGEKSPQDLGQLSCQGLNRSLMLPQYFQQHFPKPNYIFVPNPSVKDSDYSYVRPLVTIEPTAISLDMPVNAQIAYDRPDILMNKLLEEKYHHAVIYIAWEHVNILKFTRLMFKRFKNSSAIPAWHNDNYGQVFVLTIHWEKNPPTLQLTKTDENLKNISAACPH